MNTVGHATVSVSTVPASGQQGSIRKKGRRMDAREKLSGMTTGDGLPMTTVGSDGAKGGISDNACLGTGILIKYDRTHGWP